MDERLKGRTCVGLVESSRLCNNETNIKSALEMYVGNEVNNKREKST